MGLLGIDWLVQGWVFGTTGYPATLLVPKDLSYVLYLALITWLLIVAWRRKEAVQAATA
jgi:hypothetical protein